MTGQWRRMGAGIGVVLCGGLIVPSPSAAASRPGAVMTVTLIADLVERVRPAVVNIDTVAQRQVDVLPTPFSVPEPRIYEKRGLGSGFIIDPSGVIVTNNHVVQGATQVVVTLDDGRKFPARLVGRDRLLDLAVVKIEAKRLPILSFASDRQVRVGEWVIAVGSPLGLDKTVTQGIISAMHRSIAINEAVQFLQTDAPINPGNSGGPLLNLAGQVVGVNTAVASQAQGIGFAIPADVARTAVVQLRAHGRILRPWLGVGLQQITPERAKQAGLPPGLVVFEVYPATGAAIAGLSEGDVLMAIAGRPVATIQALREALGHHRPGEKVAVTLVRDGRKRTLLVTLSEMPSESR